MRRHEAGPVLRRGIAVSLLLAALLPAGAAATGSGGRIATYQAFRMPSKNVACMYFAPTLRCDILSGLVPEPRRRCDGDWTGLSVSTRGRAGAACAGDTVYDPRAPILQYGRTWRRGGITCLSLRRGIHCTNRDGRGFDLARGSWRIF